MTYLDVTVSKFPQEVEKEGVEKSASESQAADEAGMGRETGTQSATNMDSSQVKKTERVSADIGRS